MHETRVHELVRQMRYHTSTDRTVHVHTDCTLLCVHMLCRESAASSLPDPTPPLIGKRRQSVVEHTNFSQTSLLTRYPMWRCHTACGRYLVNGSANMCKRLHFLFEYT